VDEKYGDPARGFDDLVSTQIKPDDKNKAKTENKSEKPAKDEIPKQLKTSADVIEKLHIALENDDEV
jgi:hypothetical protein